MKILLDCLGGDKAPEEAIKGIAYALGKDKDIEIAAIGPAKTIKEGLEQSKLVCMVKNKAPAPHKGKSEPEL